jgi:hypothetical protein
VLTRQVLPVYIDNETMVTKYMQEAGWTMVAREDGGRRWKTGIKVSSCSNRMEDSQGIYMGSQGDKVLCNRGKLGMEAICWYKGRSLWECMYVKSEVVTVVLDETSHGTNWPHREPGNSDKHNRYRL